LKKMCDKRVRFRTSWVNVRKRLLEEWGKESGKSATGSEKGTQTIRTTACASLQENDKGRKLYGQNLNSDLLGKEGWALLRNSAEPEVGKGVATGWTLHS